MSNRLFSKPQVSAKNGRNSFDMSMRRLFTAPPGMLLPVYTDLANPGDHYKCDCSSFIRTEAVQTSAFTRFKAHFDWYAVPIRQLYAFWNEFYNGVNDVNTNFSVNSNYKLPTFDLGSAVKNIESFGIVESDDPTETDRYCSVDEFGVPYVHSFRRLADLLGFGNLTDWYNVNNKYNLHTPLLKFLAYHKIFYSRFYNNDFTKKDINLFNVDAYHGGIIPLATASKIVSTMHYRPYRTNYFNNFLPYPTFSSEYANLVTNSFFPNVTRNQLNPEEVSANLVNAVGNNTGNDQFPALSTVGLNNELAISAGDIRSLFAYDRLLRVTAIAGSSYEQQTLAHFGVKLPNGLTNDAMYLGSQECDVNISEVVTTATTDYKSGNPGTTIGDIAGKGFGASNGHGIDFTANEHSIIMCIFSIEPICDFASTGMDRTNRYRDSLDFYHPELDDLGMQPFDNTELTTSYGFDQLNPYNSAVGWQYRFSELKTKYDTVNEGFYDTFRKNWQTNYQNSIQETGLSQFDANARFYIHPQFANTIFALQFPQFERETATYNTKDGSGFANPFLQPQKIYGYDPFLIAADFQVYKSSIMSVHSLPRLS